MVSISGMAIVNVQIETAGNDACIISKEYDQECVYQTEFEGSHEKERNQIVNGHSSQHGDHGISAHSDSLLYLRTALIGDIHVPKTPASVTNIKGSVLQSHPTRTVAFVAENPQCPHLN